MKALLITAVLFAAAAATSTAHAQVGLKLPDQSPAANVSQTIGLTEITINYHRPGVAGRPIWGALVPYNETWRAGANENTTITFSTDVKVGGKPLRAGTYGLHMIPTAKDWTIAFSTMTTAWGSFTYDQKEDALRVTVTPRPSAMEERLVYRFDEPGEAKTTLVLAWEKLAVPISIEVDTSKVVMASVRGQLRGPAGFSWQGYNNAARYWLRHGGPLDEAMKLVDRSIAMTPTFQNQNTRASILDKQGNAKAAAELRAKALPLANEADMNQMGYQLLGDKKVDEALKVFKANTEKYPESSNAQDSYGEALAGSGDKAAAIAAYTKALSLAKDPAQKKRIEGILAGLKAP
jgi:hypothetical protein